MGTKAAATLAKGLQLLDAVVRDEGRSTLSELAQAANMPLPTAHRLALTLEREGFLSRAGRGRYFAGAMLNRMARVETPATRAALRLRRPLARLAKANGAFAHFGILENGMVTYLIREAGVEEDLFTAETTQLEAYCSAIGKILLAALPSPELETYLANGPFVALTGRTLIEPDAIREELNSVRRDKVGYDRYEIRDDLFCIGVGVHDRDRNIIGAISVSLIGQSIDQGRLARLRRQLVAVASRTSL